MSDKPVNTINMLKRVAKLDELLVDGGFDFVNEELKEIKKLLASTANGHS